jgi:hypothetical protein
MIKPHTTVIPDVGMAKAARQDRTKSDGPAAAGMPSVDADQSHPVVGHLSAAAGHLAAGRDLQHAHLSLVPAGPDRNLVVGASRRLRAGTAALLAETEQLLAEPCSLDRKAIRRAV